MDRQKVFTTALIVLEAFILAAVVIIGVATKTVEGVQTLVDDKKEDKVYHHIIDSKTGYPSNSGVESATIVGETALVADCLSTACVVLGEEKGKELAEDFGVELIIVSK